MDPYLSGERLYGDDFSDPQVRAWYAEERDAYADLGAKDRKKYIYCYHALNALHAYRFLGPGPLGRVLGFGSAYGDEFLPLESRIESLTIVDPSAAFRQESVGEVPSAYVAPSPTGKLPFEDRSFDMFTCFGVLHHVPNVTSVVNELFRVLAHDGTGFIREPVVSMGDWTTPRRGLTGRERGIPIKLFRKMISEAGFEIRYEGYCVFPPIPKLARLAGVVAFNDRFLTRLDAMICNALRWNLRYHAGNAFQKIRPTCVSFVLHKT